MLSHYFPVAYNFLYWFFLSEDPAGVVDGMNLYQAYMNVNYVDVMGDNAVGNYLTFYLDPNRYYYISKGIMKGLMSTVLGIYDLAGAAFKAAYIDSWEENVEKYNKGKKSVVYLLDNKEEIIKTITMEVVDYSNKYLQAVFEGKDREKMWEKEGEIAFEIASMFIGVGQVSALAKSSNFVKSIQLLAKLKLDKVLKGVKNSKAAHLVDDFLKGGSKYCHMCFVAGTQVPTAEGLKNIEDIKFGDFVMSKDMKTGKIDYKPVVNIFTVLHTELFTLTYNDKAGEAYEIKVSGEHPFWVADKGWVATRQLSIDDKLIITDDTLVSVSSLTSEQAEKGKTFTTYNFEVNDFHTYYVLQEGKFDGVFAVLVHNCNELLNGSRTFTRGGKEFTLHQGDNVRRGLNGKGGWAHIYSRHGNSGNLRYLDKTQFPKNWKNSDILNAMNDTIKHGKIQKKNFYGEQIINRRANINGIGYKNYRLTINVDGKTIRNFHILD